MKFLIALIIALSTASIAIAADFGPMTQPDCEQKSCPIGDSGQPA